MKKGEFAKIVWCQGYQIVLMISYNAEDDNYELCQTTNINGLEATIKVGLSNEETCIQVYTDYSEEQANGFIHSVKELL